MTLENFINYAKEGQYIISTYLDQLQSFLYQSPQACPVYIVGTVPA